MNELKTTNESIPALLTRASAALESAQSSGEVLEARDYARVAYDAAKSAGRMARAKSAHDEVIGAVYRAQADAALIEARAKMRLANEYDAAQERGEVSSRGGERSGREHSQPPPTAADLGLSRKDIYEARQLRDAEKVSPGIIEGTVNSLVEMGSEPTKAAIKDAAQSVTSPHVTNNSGNNEWYTPSEYIEAARTAMGSIDFDPASSEIANKTVKSAAFCTAEENGLTVEWRGNVWMNPPYSQPLIAEFCAAVSARYESGEIQQACVLVNNATETGWFQTLASTATAICFVRRRVRFIDKEGRPSQSPLQGQCVLYMGEETDSFQSAFENIGLIYRSANNG